MNAFTAEHAVRSHAFVVNLPAERAFVLFEPEGERAWAQGWDPQYVWPADGRAQAGMVFTTQHGGESTIWTIVRHDEKAGLVEYLRVTPGSRVASVIVQCARIDAARTRATVIYAMTGLSETVQRSAAPVAVTIAVVRRAAIAGVPPVVGAAVPVGGPIDRV